MATYLLPATPLFGHLSPLLTIGCGLRARGHNVTMLTGCKYAPLIQRRGLGFRPLPADADFDDAALDAWLPGWGQGRRLAAARRDVIGMFVRPLPAQYAALTAALAERPVDAVVSDAAFLGALPLLLGTERTARPPVVGISATPLSVVSVDCAPFGSGMAPGHSAFTRSRNRQIYWLLRHGPLRPLYEALDATLAPYGIPAGTLDYFNHAVAFDLTFQLSAPELEYPRRDLPPTTRFVGPLRLDPESSPAAEWPTWWGDLDGHRLVVHVTQGTMDNADLDKLLVPTLRGLAGEDLLVVAATGGRPVDALRERLGGSWPANARVAEFLPYHSLLPRIDVMVTNGGFGGVQQAVLHGVPLVVAGVTEDKPEVAARVAWSGVGINLHTGTPSPARVRATVRAVLRHDRYRNRAREIAAGMHRLGNPLPTITAAVEALSGSVTASARGRPSQVTLRRSRYR